MELNGWTNVGDKYEARGIWVIYRYSGRPFKSVRTFSTFPSDKASFASKAYKKELDKMRAGGIWLVSPNGEVIARKFYPPER
jgi:hypothetical protein